jgi:hypothetical protein
MNYQHKELAAGRWAQMPLVEQMANVGSEVGRALNWRAKHNEVYADQAMIRALELLWLTIEGARKRPGLRELVRVREALLDYFYGDNEYRSTDEQWNKYFLQFAYAARKDR